MLPASALGRESTLPASGWVAARVVPDGPAASMADGPWTPVELASRSCLVDVDGIGCLRCGADRGSEESTTITTTRHGAHLGGAQTSGGGGGNRTPFRSRRQLVQARALALQRRRREGDLAGCAVHAKGIRATRTVLHTCIVARFDFRLSRDLADREVRTNRRAPWPMITCAAVPDGGVNCDGSR